jgi:dihydroxyacetone kinase-like protein
MCAPPGHRAIHTKTPFQSGDVVVALVSGLGATPVMELYIASSKIYDILQDTKINVHRSYVGNYFTSLEMMGISFTPMKIKRGTQGFGGSRS